MKTAFILFLQTWITLSETLDDLTDDDIVELYKKWIEIFLPSLNQPHSGDCTQMPWSCVRCHTEEYIRQGKRIEDIITHTEHQNQKENGF